MWKHLSRWAWAAALILFSGCIGVSRVSEFTSWDSDHKSVAYADHSGAIPPGLATLEVDNRFGSIHVTGSDDSPGDWTWQLAARASSDERASAAAALATCQPEWDGKRLRLIVSLPESRRESFQSDLVIRLPRSARVETRNRFGKTEVADVAGGVTVLSQHGAVAIRNVNEEVRAETSFGSMEVTGAGSASLKNQHGKIGASNIRGDLAAETSFGGVTALDVGGTTKLVNHHGAIKGRNLRGIVEARTSFGPLDIETSGPAAECRNHHGGVRLAQLSSNLARINAETSFGPLELTLPAAIEPAINARTSFGEIDSEFPVLMMPRGQDPFLLVNSAKPRVNLANHHGPIRIQRR